jgi:hypothetical protein
VQYSGTGTIFCGDNRIGRRYYCVPRVFNLAPVFCSTTKAAGSFSTSAKIPESQRHSASRSAQLRLTSTTMA